MKGMGQIAVTTTAHMVEMKMTVNKAADACAGVLEEQTETKTGTVAGAMEDQQTVIAIMERE